MSADPVPGDRPALSASRPRDVVIEARGLHKAYRVYARPQDRLREMVLREPRHQAIVAVRELDLDVMRGETVGVVGRNGSGKSTLLHMISGTLEPTSGSLRVAGHVAPILTLGAGFNPDFTGRENVEMNAAILGIGESDLRDRWDDIVAFADIGAFLEQPVKTYSAGMQARLAFAVAIHASPDILVIDEILSVGDEAFNRKCFSRIEALKQAGSTILFVSHSAGLIVELCDRAVLMENGERLLTADPKTVIGRYHRLLYAPADELPAIRASIRDLDRARTGGTEPGPEGERIGASAALREPAGADAHGTFDPGLSPESTVEYVRNGAAIRDARILDSKERVVNVLRAGHDYVYAFEVDFDEAAFDVRFGMMIKLVTGVELGGQASHPVRRGLAHVPAGSTARVRFHFRSALTPGIYFMNAGVLGTRDGQQGYLHRILDAAVFRIDPEQPGIVTGSVDLSTGTSAAVEIDPTPPG